MVKITLLSQIISLLPRENFIKLVRKYNSNKYVKGVDSWTHLVSMLFCHLAKAGSVRDISNGLRSITGNISHLGMKRVPSKSSLSYINQHRDWKLFRDYYFQLLDHFQNFHTFKREKLLRLRKKIFIIDASLIPLCLSIFDWARYRRRKGAIKLHLVLDYDGCLPVFADLTNGKVHELNVAREVDFPKGSIVVFDRGFFDYEWMNKLDSKSIFFVTRVKKNMDYWYLESREIPEDDKNCIKEDALIELSGYKSSQQYPGKLRIVTFLDEKENKELSFLTNNLYWTAKTVAQIYKERWSIEVFFKQLKQNMKIKTFVGTSFNAVMIQLWTALISMLVLCYLKSKAEYNWHLSNLITFIRLNLFVKISLFEWLNNPFYKIPNTVTGYQLNLFSG